ncbi:glycosyltransferase family 2 protein [Tessaracoccus sp. Z1128]
MTLASVIIPSRGGAQRLPALLSALAAQDDPAWEAIVVIDGDIDGSASVVARYERQLPVHCIVFPENRGRVAALNAGFQAAAGDVLIRCDDDLVPDPGFIRTHKAEHLRGPHGAIGLYLNRLPDTPYALAYGRDADARFRRDAYAAASDRVWRYWAGNCSVTREVWEKVGPYDPDYRAYGWEDVDWGYRLHRLGVPVRLVPALETPHFVAAVTTRSRVLRAFHSGAARRLFEAKHGTDLLASAVPPQRGVWNRLVHLTARFGSRKGLDLASRCVDHSAAILPRAVSGKVIALLVEGAAVAGYQRPGQITTEF